MTSFPLAKIANCTFTEAIYSLFFMFYKTVIFIFLQVLVLHYYNYSLENITSLFGLYNYMHECDVLVMATRKMVHYA